MENDQKVDGVVTENNASEQEVQETEQTVASEVNEAENDSTESESKPKFTPEELLAIRKREVKKLEKQLGIAEEKPKSKSKTKSDELDYSQKAYLKVNGIDKEDFEFVSEFMRETGKDLDDALASKYFHAELKERKEARSVENAVPQRTSGRNNVTPASRTPEYWLSKGDFELPEDRPENRQLIQQVIAARYEAKKKGY